MLISPAVYEKAFQGLRQKQQKWPSGPNTTHVSFQASTGRKLQLLYTRKGVRVRGLPYSVILVPKSPKNVSDMENGHGNLVPDRDSSQDAKGPLKHLFTIINKFEEDLYCGTAQESVSGIETNLNGQGHRMILSSEAPARAML